MDGRTPASTLEGSGSNPMKKPTPPSPVLFHDIVFENHFELLLVEHIRPLSFKEGS
jgi:hypothetical protein